MSTLFLIHSEYMLVARRSHSNGDVVRHLGFLNIFFAYWRSIREVYRVIDRFHVTGLIQSVSDILVRGEIIQFMPPSQTCGVGIGQFHCNMLFMYSGVPRLQDDRSRDCVPAVRASRGWNPGLLPSCRHTYLTETERQAVCAHPAKQQRCQLYYTCASPCLQSRPILIW